MMCIYEVERCIYEVERCLLAKQNFSRNNCCFNKSSPPLFAATGRGMKFSFSFLNNLLDDINGIQPVINEGADWHMSGADSLLSVQSSALWQSRIGTEPLLMHMNVPSLKKNPKKLLNKAVWNYQIHYFTKNLWAIRMIAKKNKRVQKQSWLVCCLVWRILHIWSYVTRTA